MTDHAASLPVGSPQNWRAPIPRELDAAVAEVGGNARAVQSDVANFGDLDQLYEIVQNEAGRIDVLLANAGGGEFTALADITEAHYDRIFGTNVKGTLFTVQKALPLLVDGGSVILTGSTMASRAHRRSACTAPARPPSATSPAAGSSILRPDASG